MADSNKCSNQWTVYLQVIKKNNSIHINFLQLTTCIMFGYHTSREIAFLIVSEEWNMYILSYQTLPFYCLLFYSSTRSCLYYIYSVKPDFTIILFGVFNLILPLDLVCIIYSVKPDFTTLLFAVFILPLDLVCIIYIFCLTRLYHYTVCWFYSSTRSCLYYI